MAQEVDGRQWIRRSVSSCFRAQKAFQEGDQRAGLFYLSVALEQLAGGVDSALQDIYEHIEKPARK